MSKHSQSYIWQPIPPTTSLLNPTANVSSIECNLSSTNSWAERVPQHCHPSNPVEFWPLIIVPIFKLNLVMWKGKLEKKGNFGDKLARYLAFEDGDMLIAPQLDHGWPKQEIEGLGGGDYVTQYPPMEHPLKMGYDSVVDEPQLSYQGSTYTPKASYFRFTLPM